MGEAIARVREAVLDAHAHQDVPFEKVVEHLAPERSPNAPPLYQTLFSFHDSPVRTLAVPNATIVPQDALPNGSAKLDVSVVVINRRGGTPGPDAALAEEGLTVAWEYNTDLFERVTAERMLGHFLNLLEQFATAEEEPLASLAVADEPEQARLRKFAGGTRPYERDATIAEVFSARAAETPHAVAVSFDGETLGYARLDRWANRLAHRLRALGVGLGGRVSVCMERSPEMVVAYLAVLKAGAAYVPLDPRDPSERLRRQMDALGVGLALSLARHQDVLPGRPLEAIFLDDVLDLEREPDTAPAPMAGPLDPAYVMFTSGSTGAPKGVEVPHRAVLRLVRGADYVRLGPEETLLGLAPAAFDAATFEVWGALLNGGRLALAPPGPLAPAELADVVAREGVTTLWLTAGLFHRVVDDRPELLRSLRQLLAGGDVLSPDHVRRALRALPPGAVLVNGYGPTEGTTFTTAHRMHPGEHVEGAVPIGRPIANTRVYILDRNGGQVPIGAVGELHVGGDGVALGYAGDPDLTAKRFLPDPFAEGGARMYRSGDRARWRLDGTVEFLGRADRQLKVRGFRIEPREVEEALRSHPAVADVFVTGYERPGRDRALAAYVVPAAGARASDAELRAHAARALPAYAVPTGWCRLERLPLGTSGKVDAAALPAPESGARRAFEARGRRRLDPLERRLTEIWERALDVDGIDPDDDFFAIGGHSLLAIEVFDAIERSLGQRLPLAMIFEAPTVRLLAAALREEAAPEIPGSLVTLTSTGDRPPLFFVAAGDGNSVGFGALARRLGPDQPFFALQPRGINGGALLHTTVEGMARHYLRAIRRVRPKGPYLLGGRCLGAVVAYEMARQLVARGEDVPLLVVLDSGGPLWEPRHLTDGTPFDEHMNRALQRPDSELKLDPFSPEGGAPSRIVAARTLRHRR